MLSASPRCRQDSTENVSLTGSPLGGTFIAEPIKYLSAGCRFEEKQ